MWRKVRGENSLAGLERIVRGSVGLSALRRARTRNRAKRVAAAGAEVGDGREEFRNREQRVYVKNRTSVRASSSRRRKIEHLTPGIIHAPQI